MLKKILLVTASVVAALTAFVGIAYLTNGAPDAPVITAEAVARADKPFVVKMHAQWCSVCMVTKGVWSEVEATYASRVNLVVMDFTNETATERSRVEAQRLGLGQFFAEYAGATGVVVVLDGRTRELGVSSRVQPVTNYQLPTKFQGPARP